ncbi:hypothetical protein PRIPAC_87628 [Pristionchus pacificus]|uniref:Uncharacterized protein n=1 Tax=Pristionchus pacificus TaxID=54126 RepID=A0A2A6B5Z4_PRIPA|nr:hypothetical protein PRIPAC_87628 [Pristionchus pacificus]|eukprot:PDM61297.1 hypothetical protein PRIPAC_50739 [Pristionchus pacificus]
MFDQSIDPRRQYRSVAYGTWKVGGARALMNARSTDDVNKIVRRRILDSSSPHLDRIFVIPPPLPLYRLRMGESNPCLNSMGRSSHPKEEVHLSPLMTSSLFSPSVYIFILLSFPIRVDDSSRFHPISIPLSRDDCYSSNEYVVYKSQENIIDNLNCNGDNSSLGPSSHNSRSIATSLQRSHYRSASAGAESSYRVNGIHAIEKSIEDERRRERERRPSKKSGVFNVVFVVRTTIRNRLLTRVKWANPMGGAKQFFKKMYNSATLPSKKNSVSNGSIKKEEREDKEEKNDPLYENVHNVSYSSYIFPHKSSSLSIDTHSSSHVDRIDDYRSQLATCSYSQKDDGQGTSYADSGVVDESSSSPDESLSSITTTRISMGGDENWDDLLLHLKKELLLMRERDAQILADLHKVESQLQNVRMNTMLDSP